MSPTRPTLPSALFALALLALATPAQGYNRTRTSLGVPAAWTQMPITYYIGKKGSKDVTDGSDIDAIKRSFATWAAVDCAALTFRLGGLIDNPKGAYEPKGDNQNHVYWVEPPEKWPFAEDVVAVTTVFYQPATGT